MKILFLSSVLPHAKVISGPIIIYNRIKLLAERGYEVGLAAFVTEEGARHRTELESMLIEMQLVPLPPPPPISKRLTRALFSPVPSVFRPLRSERMKKLVGTMIDEQHYDIVIAEFSAMGQYLYGNPFLPPVRRIVSVHECCTVACTKALKLQRRPLGALKHLLMVKGLRSHEFNMYRNADHILVLTPQERYNLLRYEPDLRISVIPYGVDVKEFVPAEQEPAEIAVLYTGFYLSEANQDAVTWFATTAWPNLKAKHPALTFYVVGPKPTPAMKELARRDPSIVITGRVDDVKPYFRKAKAFVCPVRMGSGFRGKILEAMAAGVPVVSTTLGAEGFPCHNGRNILLADTPHGFAENVDVLLRDPELGQSLARNARDLVTSRFSWSHSVDLLEQVLKKTMNAR